MGVLSARQATVRFGTAVVRRRLSSGRWVSPRPGVICCHNGPLTPMQSLWAVLLAGPARSALGGWSALACDGLAHGFGEQPHLIIPGSARAPHLPGVRVLRSRALGVADVHPDRQPRRTRPARSAVDAAVLAATPRSARLALVRVVQQGLARPGDLTAVLAHRGQCRYLGVLRETATDLAGGARSLPEREFARLVLTAGLPTPARQAVVRGRNGRYYLDCDWPQLRLAAEVHGIQHLLMQQQESDWVRHNELTIGGRAVLHFTSFDVRHRGDHVIAVLRSAAARRAVGHA